MSTSATTSQTQPQRPPVTVHPTAHLDPGAYVRGTHAITLGANVLIHPRAQLISLHGPLIISDGVVVGEKCVIGGPVGDPKDAPGSTQPKNSSADASGSPAGDGEDEADPIKTLVGPAALLHPHSAVHAGGTLGEACTVEAHATVTKSGRVGAHAKLCGGVVVDGEVREWEVVGGGGNGSQWRRKRVDGEEVEKARLQVMEREREVTVGILRRAVRAGVVRAKK